MFRPTILRPPQSSLIDRIQPVVVLLINLRIRFDLVFEVTGHTGFEQVIELRQNLLEVFRGYDACQLLCRFVMGHGQIMVGRRKVFRPLESHHLAMPKETEVRFGQAFR